MRVFLPAVVAALLSAAGHAAAQFDLLNSPTNASLRGVSSPGAGVGWVSGSDGAIFRSEDGGYLWQRCATPPGGEHLDFRGIQAFDADTALVMASGKGPLSKVFKTTDGCATWKLVFDDPDMDGFFDALVFDHDRKTGYLLGDPVGGRFALFVTVDRGSSWTRSAAEGLAAAAPGIGAFAASNSSFTAPVKQFATGGPDGPFLYSSAARGFIAHRLPMQGASASAGIFSLAAWEHIRVAVGGDYTKPNDMRGTAAYSLDSGVTWSASTEPPHGYRSSVVYDAKHRTWLAVGTNGSDISFDDGKTWRLLAGPNASGWNAIALPFLVGSHGQIATVPDTVFSKIPAAKP